MGNCCPVFRRIQKEKQSSQIDPPVSTQRSLQKITIKQQDNLKNNFTYFPDQQRKSSDFCINLNKNTASFNKISTKGLSTEIGSSLGVQKSIGSSFNLITNFNIPNMIIISVNSSFPSTSFQNQDYYTLIDGVSYVRKTNQQIDIQTPAEAIKVMCQQQNIMNTLFLASGIPIDEVSIFPMNKLIQIQKSPIKIKLYLNCKSCKKQKKITYSLSVIQIHKIICDQCQQYGNWGIKSITSSYPLWGNATKIDQGRPIANAPTFVRALGCIYCFRFTQSQQLSCKCLICLPCKLQKIEKFGVVQCCFCCGERP